MAKKEETEHHTSGATLKDALDCFEALERIAKHRSQCQAHSAEHRLLDQMEAECRAHITAMAPEPPK